MACDNGIVLLSLAQNCANYIPTFFNLVRGVASTGMNVVAVVGENGSSDNTRHLIESEQRANPNIIHIDTSFMAKIRSRLPRMAHGRQELAAYAAVNFPNAQYVCVVDVDNVLSTSLNPQELLSSASQLHTRTDIFGVSASSKPYYYDISALRCRNFLSNNIYPEIMKAKGNIFGYYAFMRRNLFAVQRDFTASQYRLCESAFNGLCIYRAADYYSSSYIGEDQDDVCEHVIFNERLHRSTGKRILVDDKLTLYMPPEHGPQSFPSFAIRRFIKLAKRLV